jgi:hypothetical protein
MLNFLSNKVSVLNNTPTYVHDSTMQFFHFPEIYSHFVILPMPFYSYGMVTKMERIFMYVQL